MSLLVVATLNKRLSSRLTYKQRAWRPVLRAATENHRIPAVEMCPAQILVGIATENTKLAMVIKFF